MQEHYSEEHNSYIRSTKGIEIDLELLTVFILIKNESFRCKLCIKHTLRMEHV